MVISEMVISEIDILTVFIDELSQCATFFEIKRQPKELDLSQLEQYKAEFLTATRSLKGYEISTQGLTMEDM